MLDSFLFLAVFLAGIAAGRQGAMPDIFLTNTASLYILWGFMFLTGMAIGSGRKMRDIFRALNIRLLGLPAATVCGTFFGAAILGLFGPWPLRDCMTASAGFGYYSLSSILISQYRGSELGAVALISNILRELLTLILAPAIFRICGAWPLISAGGCTTSDTTLPVIIRYAGPDYILPAIAHAMLLDFSVPFWVMLFCELADI